MSLAIYISFAVSPVLLIIGVLMLRYSFKVKNWGNIRNAVALGVLSVVLVVGASYLAEMRWHGDFRTFRHMGFYVFVVIAFSAEIAKYIALRSSFYHLKNFEGPIEGIIYSNFIALGYSMIAVVLFAYGIIGSPGIKQFAFFLLFYPFANLVFSTSMGFFIGMGKLRKNRLIDNSTGIFVSTFFHGLYYFAFIMNDIAMKILIAVGFVLIAFILISRAIKLRKSKD